MNKTPDQLAQAVLDNHAIRSHWRRDGEQILALIAEGIEADRAERAGVLSALKRERAILASYESDAYRLNGVIGHQITRALEAMDAVLASE